jgi:hypothetical protein
VAAAVPARRAREAAAAAMVDFWKTLNLIRRLPQRAKLGLVGYIRERTPSRNFLLVDRAKLLDRAKRGQIRTILLQSSPLL